MTDDYKLNLLNYVTQNLTTTSSNINLKPKYIKKIETSIDEILTAQLGEKGAGWSGFEVAGSVTRGDYFIIILSVSFIGTNQNMFTFFLTLDKNFQFVNLDSLNSIENMVIVNSNDTGTGRIFGISRGKSTLESNYETTWKIVIINDFTLENFNIKLLKSYNIPDNNGVKIAPIDMYKNEDSGSYSILYTKYNSIAGGTLEFINNVGSSNEWNFYEYSGTKELLWAVAGQLPTWTDNNYNVKILTSYERAGVTSGNSATPILLVNQSTNNSKSLIESATYSIPAPFSDVTQPYTCKTTNNLGIVTINKNGYSPSDSGVILINYEDSSVVILEYHRNDSNNIGNIFRSFIVQNRICWVRQNYEYELSSGVYNYTKNDIYLSQYFNSQTYSYLIYSIPKEEAIKTDDHYKFTILNLHKFNLYNYLIIFDNFILEMRQVFNQNNYNGDTYIDYNSLLPKWVNLYNQNNEIIFSRNLYNKVVLNNLTTATLNVPNNDLNNTTISIQDLISETNSTIVSNRNGMTKNIYENLFINFLLTYNVLDRNSNIEKVMNDASNKINNSINNATDETSNVNYFNDSCTIMRLTYEDGTTEDKRLDKEYDSNLDSIRLHTSFIVNKKIKRIDFISVSNIVYATIEDNLDTIEVDELYSFEEYVRVE